MQLKVISAFAELEARRKLRQWINEHPNMRVVQQKTMPAAEGIGSFEGTISVPDRHYL